MGMAPVTLSSLLPHSDNRVRRVTTKSSGGIKSEKGLSQCKQAAASSALCMQRGRKKLSVNTEHTLGGENLMLWGQLNSTGFKLL